MFIWIEVLSAVTTPLLKPYCTAIADAWLAIKLKVRLLQIYIVLRNVLLYILHGLGFLVKRAA